MTRPACVVSHQAGFARVIISYASSLPVCRQATLTFCARPGNKWGEVGREGEEEEEKKKKQNKKYKKKDGGPHDRNFGCGCRRIKYTVHYTCGKKGPTCFCPRETPGAIYATIAYKKIHVHLNMTVTNEWIPSGLLDSEKLREWTSWEERAVASSHQPSQGGHLTDRHPSAPPSPPFPAGVGRCGSHPRKE